MGFIKKEPAQIDSPIQAEKPDYADLVSDLDAPSPAKRLSAARELADFPDSAGLLVNRFKHETNLSVRAVIATALTRIGDATAVAGLVEGLRCEDAALRNQAIAALKKLPDTVAAVMEDLLVDDDPDVRIFAVNVLESLCHPKVQTWLIQVIDADPHVNVCATAVDLLSEVGTSAARAPLERLKQRFVDEPYIQFAAGLALERIHEG